jgi:hydrogenase maturation protease
MSHQPQGRNKENPTAGRIVIIGVGNLLLKDEGLGIHAVRELKKKALPPAVEVLDGGVAGIGLLDLFQGARKLVFIDAADMSLAPGAVVRFTPDEIRSQSEIPRFSAHDVGVLEVLELARALGQCPPEVVIIGVQPKEISGGMDLTPEVQAVLPQVLEAALKEIDLIATEDTEATEKRT